MKGKIILAVAAVAVVATVLVIRKRRASAPVQAASQKKEWQASPAVGVNTGPLPPTERLSIDVDLGEPVLRAE
jgi:hypothetical protein